jgi:hypothetical protein
VTIDYPEYSTSITVEADTTIEALRAQILTDSALEGVDLSRYVMRSATFGKDINSVDDLEQTLAEAEVTNGSSVIFLAPANVKPQRGKTAAEKRKEEKEEQKTTGAGFGKYKAFNLSNCFRKFRELKKPSEKELCTEFIEAKGQDLFVKGSAYLRLRKSDLATVLALDRLSCKESELLDAVFAWGVSNKQTEHKALRPLLDQIRFPTMEAKTIASLIMSQPALFNSDQALSLFQHCALPPSLRPNSLAGFSETQCRPRDPRFIGCIFAKWGSKLTESEDKRSLTYSGSSNWQGSALGTPINKYSFKVTGPCSNLMAGFSPEDIKIEGNNYSGGKGFYLYLNNWSLYGKGKSGTSYTSGSNTINTIVTCEWNPDEGTIKFYHNGTDKGVAYTGVPNSGLVPAFDFYDSGSSIEFCDHPEGAQ